MKRPAERSIWRRRLPWMLPIPLGVALQLVAERFPALADGWAAHLYPVWARMLGSATGWAPFSVAEALGVGLAVAIVVALARRKYAVTLANLLAGTGLVYAAFLPWGLNYARTPFAVAAGYDRSPPALDELRALAEELVERANQTRRAAAEDGEGLLRLSGSRREALDRGRLAFAGGHAGRAKGFLLLSPLMTRLGASGIYVMVTGEPTVNLDLPASELPFVVCHELGHQLGWAREDEASFAGYLACAGHPDPDFRYSAELAAFDYAISALRRADPVVAAEVEARCSDGVRRDREAERAFWRRHRTRVTEAASRAYDVYLRSQGETAGRASYGRVVDLLVAERRERGRSGLSVDEDSRVGPGLPPPSRGSWGD